MAPEPIDTIALLQSNIPEDATVLIRVGTTSATADANYGPYPFRASATVPGRPGYHGLFRLPAAVSKEYWRVDIKATPPGHHQHGTSSARARTCQHVLLPRAAEP